MLFVTGCAKPPLGIYEVSKQTVKFKDSLSMDLYSPIDIVHKPRPTVLWIHGGGWAGGSRGDAAPLARFTASMGFTSASTDYRLTLSGVKYPDIYSDVLAAYNYLRDNADELEVDPHQIFVGGDSAGAHLAMMLGLQNDVQGIIDIYGPVDLISVYHGDTFSLEKLFLYNLIGVSPEQDEAAWQNASPINFVSSSSPPILILHGRYDTIVPIAEGRKLAERAKKLGVRHVFTESIATHGWTLAPFSESHKRTLPMIANFLRQECNNKDYSDQK